MEFWNSIFGSKEPTVNYCEPILEGLIARPGYFISNIAYIFGGIYLLTRKSKIEKLFGIISILIGIASGIYDASFRFNAQIIDLSVMFLFINLIVVLNLKRALNIKGKVILVSLFTIFELAYILLISQLEGSSGRIFFGVFVIIAIISEIFLILRDTLAFQKYKYWLAGLFLFLIGFSIWLLDANLIWCDPTNILNGRGVYHYLTSITVVLIGIYYSKILKIKE